MNNTVKLLEPFNCVDEENGFFSMKTNCGDFIMNSQGKFILDNLYDGISLKELVDIFQRKYSVVQKQAELDIKEFLSSLKIVGIIHYENDFSAPQKKFNIAGELEYSSISEKIYANFNSTNNTWYSISKKKDYYNAYSLRSKSFNHHEVYYYSYDDQIDSIIGLTNMSENNLVIGISLIQTSKGEDDLRDLYNYIENELKRLNRHKIRITLPENISSRTIDLIKEFKFIQEGYLLLEDGKNNYYLFSKVLGN